MKIVSAECRPEAGGKVRDGNAYLATVKVMSDSITHTGNGWGGDPNEATHKALSEACEKFTQALHDSISVGVEIKF